MDLFRREQYLSKFRGFYHDTDIIKVITGDSLNFLPSISMNILR